MGDLLQPAHLLVLLIVFSVFFLIPGILYLLTLQNALSKCHPSVREMEPGMVWLVSWLKPKLPGIAVTHIASHSPFTWY